jgi:hypothetical protein
VKNSENRDFCPRSRFPAKNQSLFQKFRDQNSLLRGKRRLYSQAADVGCQLRTLWKGCCSCSTLIHMSNLFRDLEERLLHPEVRRSPDEAGKLLAADFIEFGSSGAVYSRQQILDGLLKESPMALSATDFSVRVLSDGVVLVTYRGMSRDPASGRERHSLRSSIWKLVDSRWLMTFHQGTPTRQIP